MHTEYEPVIGIEVHAQLLTRTKVFCGCATSFGAPPNTHVCPVCLGLPGALPSLNREVVAMAVRTGLALGCTIRPRSRFARKNYFYPDLPKGYQISQYDEPICERGQLDVPMPDGSSRTIGIERAHIEEDAGKNIHGGDGREVSRVDLNRAGVPLLEIVSRPDLRGAVEAAEYLRQLRAVLMFLGVNDGNLEEGSFRCDVNVSVRPKGQERFGTRVEVKNINSFRFVQKALEWEITHQIATIAAGGTIEQVTKTWDDVQSKCVFLRKKEGSDDYRYFPDPDLSPIEVSDDWIATSRAALPTLPAARRAQYAANGVSPADAKVLTEHPAVAAYYEELVARTGDPRRAANWVCNVVKGDVRTAGLGATFPVTVAQLAGLFARLDDGTISGRIAKDLYADLVGTDRTADALIDAKGLRVMSDPAAVEAACRTVLDANPKQVAAYRAGKKNLLGYFKGEVMKSTGGRADPRALDAALQRLLGDDQAS